MTALLRGSPAAPGVAIAPPFVIVTPVVDPGVAGAGPVGTPAEEKAAATAALAQAARELEELAARVRPVAGDEAEIFEAHAAFAEDPELAATTARLIDEGRSAAAAVTQAFAGFRALLEASTSEYLAARAADLDDVAGRVVAILRGASTTVAIPDEASVVLARELSPSQTAELPRDRIAALVTEAGSPTSHAAILARSLGIPAVVGVAGVLALAAGARVLAVDGRAGEVLVDPLADEVAVFRARRQLEEARRQALTSLRGQPGRTADGTRIELAANIGGREDVVAALAAGAEGAGLVRTEFLFQGRQSEPSVEEQAAYYGEVLDGFPGGRVVFRTLDIGADKPMPFVAREPEPNPALGLRGIRLSLRRPKLFEDQLRALVRAHARRSQDSARVAIMFPLVSRVEEVHAARAELRRVAGDEGVDLHGVEFGVMVEVPSAALAARRIAPVVDFLSIGTNDLLQYLFAADRLVSEVADLADPCEPVVLDLVTRVVEAAAAAGTWVGVCGEAASDPVMAGALVGIGVTELSMSPAGIPEVKELLLRHTRSELAAAARMASGAASAADARRTITRALGLSEAPGHARGSGG